MLAKSFETNNVALTGIAFCTLYALRCAILDAKYLPPDDSRPSPLPHIRHPQTRLFHSIMRISEIRFPAPVFETCLSMSWN